MAAVGHFLALKDAARVFVVADVHGCLATLKTLLRRICYCGEPLFLLGDYVNKGPDSKGTLDFVIQLAAQYPAVFPLRGNHEAYLLSYLQNQKSSAVGERAKAHIDASGEFASLSEAEKQGYINFLASLPHYYETEDCYIVHAGFDFSAPSIFEHRGAMLTIREFAYDKQKAGGKKIIHGHYPRPLAVVQRAVEEQHNVIPLDNGCVYAGKRRDMGHLCCLELKEMKLTAVFRVD